MHPPLVCSILVATDLSENSDMIVRTAARIAQHQGAALHVLNVLDLDASRDRKHAGRITFQSRIESCRRALADQVRRMVPEGVEVQSQELMIYAPEKAIVEQATGVSADLIVFGPHRKRAFADAFLGSTADHVIRHAQAPCLLVRGELPIPINHVLVPVDLSEMTARTLDVALAWSHALSGNGAGTAEVRVLHVAPYTTPDVEDFPDEHTEIHRSLTTAIKDAMHRAGGADGVQVREEIIWRGVPAEEIVRSTERESTDLLVLGTHGYGALGRALIGSVASRVTRQAPCSVLLVPPALLRNEAQAM